MSNFKSNSARKYPKIQYAKNAEHQAVYESKTDLEIWQDFKRGNESAFTFIYRLYFRPLYTYASQFIGDTELIKDCIQDLFIEIRRKRKNLSDTTSIKLYLFKAIKRKVLAAQKQHKIPFSQFQGYDFNVVLSVEHLMINQQLEEDKIRLLKQGLAKLTKRQSEVIYYFYYENMTYKEVMEMMGLNSVKSARNLVYKALNVLKIEADKFE